MGGYKKKTNGERRGQVAILSIFPLLTMEGETNMNNQADYESRHPVGDLESYSSDVESAEHIPFVARNSVPKAGTLSEIESVTAKDSMLQSVM